MPIPACTTIRPFLRVTLLLLAGGLAGCAATLDRVGMGGGGGSGSGASGSQTVQTNADGQIDVRQFYGSGYCPVIEVRDGTQVIRRHAGRGEPTEEAVIWQASISETARQCQDDPSGTMTIRVGVSGRVLAGPKGGPATVTVPVRIAVVKYKEAVLSSQLYKEQVTIGPELSTVFRRVYEVKVPSPGEDHDYLIYVGFDDGK